MGGLGDPLPRGLSQLERAGIGFGIWAGIYLLRAMATVRALAEGDVGWFGVGFGRWRSQEKLWWGWRILF